MATAAKEMLVSMNNYNITKQLGGEGEGVVGVEDVHDATDKLSYEIFSILESKFLFGYDDHTLWLPNSNPNPNPNPEPSPVLDPSSIIKTQRGKVCILGIDGGGGIGMRGILPGKALSYLEQSLKSKSGDPNATIAGYFDVVAGSGVGGLFASMLSSTRDGSRPNFTADDTWRFLVNNGKRLFRKQSATPSSPSCFFSCVFNGGGATESMERAMKETFGDNTSLKDTLKPLLVPCYDMLTSAPLVFSRADALESESYDFRLWEVCRATWAEPGRFEPVEMRSVDGRTVCVGVDGGLAMSNPAAAAITHVLHNKQEFPFVRGVEDVMVLSLGCGVGGGPDSSGGAAVYQKIRKWGTKEWARPIARIASDGAADLVDHAVAMAFGQCQSSNYIRIQANGSSMVQCGSDADCDPSCRNLQALFGAAEKMLKQKNLESVMFGGKRIGEKSNMEKLDWFAGELVLEHQRRSCRIAPTVAFKQPTTKSSNT